MSGRCLRTIVLTLLLAAVPQVPAAQDMRRCAVDAIEGDDARAWTAGAWRALAPAAEIAHETKVVTGPDTRLRIRCDDGFALTVGAATEVNLERLAEIHRSRRGIVLQLIDGILGLAGHDASGAPKRVLTPLAIASVRSTRWLVEHDAEAGTAVFVREGGVAVENRAGGTARLAAGEGITIEPDGTAGEVKTWGAPRIARSTAALGFDWP